MLRIRLRRMGKKKQASYRVVVADQDSPRDGAFFKQSEAIIFSMTPAERRNPDVLNGSRRRRIAKGSGTTPADVNRLLNQFKDAKKLMQAMTTGKGAGGLMRMLGM